MATVPGICDNCGAVFGSEALTGAEGQNIKMGGAKVGPCPACGSVGQVPEGVYDLIDDTLSVIKMTAETVIYDAIIEVLEDRVAGKATDAEVMDRIEATAPALALTVKRYLAKSDPASWIAMLISILMLLQSSSAPSHLRPRNSRMRSGRKIIRRRRPQPIGRSPSPHRGITGSREESGRRRPTTNRSNGSRGSVASHSPCKRGAGRPPSSHTPPDIRP
jgi:hypothetical protein